jgi:hypothetical protein
MLLKRYFKVISLFTLKQVYFLIILQNYMASWYWA